MIFVILCTLSGIVISTVFKYADSKGHNCNNITLVNYFIAAMIPLYFALSGGMFSLFDQLGNIDLSAIFIKDSKSATLALVLILGVSEGILYLVDIMLEKVSIIKNGTNITTFFKNISFLVNLPLSALFWHELPTALQWIAVVLILIGLALVIGNLSELKVTHYASLIWIPLLSGLMTLGIKVFSVYGIADFEQLFLFVIYLVAFISSGVNIWLETVRGKKSFRFTLPELLWGCLCGGSNIAFSFCSLRAMQRLPIYIVLPVQTGGIFLLTAVIGRFLFNDRLSRKQIAAIALVIVSLVLMNL